jgi:hypothetical protein
MRFIICRAASACEAAMLEVAKLLRQPVYTQDRATVLPVSDRSFQPTGQLTDLHINNGVGFALPISISRVQAIHHGRFRQRAEMLLILVP